MLNYRRCYFFVALLTILFLWLFIIVSQYNESLNKTHTFDGFDNVTGTSELIVPNIVHFVIFGRTSLDFISFICILAAVKVQNPERVLIHSDMELRGKYWIVLQSLNTTVEVRQREKPTHVFGQPLSSIYHATDVARIQIMLEYGGIYLDADTIVLRSLDHFRHFEMAVGWPPGQYIGTQILVGHKEARFLPLWLGGYQRYQPRDWYFNAGQHPTQQILEKSPWLVHRVPYLFGVDNLNAHLYGVSQWPQWRLHYAIHLLSRHPPAPQNLDEKSIMNYRTPIGEIIRWILFKLEPKVNIPDLINDSSLPR